MLGVFHVPYRSARRLNALIEEYKRDAEQMSVARLQELIEEAYAIHRDASAEGSTPNPFVFFTSGVWVGLMDGRRNAKLLMRTYENRLHHLEERQEELEAERQRLNTATAEAPEPPQERNPWWIRLWIWAKNSLGGSKSSPSS
jgi:hypothetical protein